MQVYVQEKIMRWKMAYEMQSNSIQDLQQKQQDLTAQLQHQQQTVTNFLLRFFV